MEFLYIPLSHPECDFDFDFDFDVGRFRSLQSKDHVQVLKTETDWPRWSEGVANHIVIVTIYSRHSGSYIEGSAAQCLPSLLLTAPDCRNYY